MARHLSIRDLDWRSLFLSDSSFHAIDDHTGPRERSGPRRFFSFFSFLPLLLRFVLFLSKRLHNNRPYCDHGAPLNLNYYAQKKFSCLPGVSPPSLTGEFTACLLRRMILSVFHSLQRRFHFRLSRFPVFFSSKALPRQLRNHRDGRSACRLLSKFLHV